MNYEETLTYIHNTPKFSRILGNDLLRKLLDKLGNPQGELKFIHIAGTNGKGSCAVMLSEVLIRSGYRVGLYTSPYIERFNERIRVNGEMISDDALALLATHVRDTIEKYDTPVSEFALDTAIAFEYFRQENCDIVVLETGLGGRLDATNVVDNKLVSVLMSIGLDHTQYLGGTIGEITAEKCGIIREKTPTVVYPDLPEEALSVINDFCAEKNSELISAVFPDIKDGNSFSYHGVDYTLGLSGDFQKYNAVTVLEVIGCLRTIGYNISDTAVADGLKNAFNPARLECLDCGIILDGAHNAPAVSALCSFLAKSDNPVHLCIAMMEDKDISECISIFSRLTKSITVTEINMPRCATAERLAEEFLSHGIHVQIEKDPIRAVESLADIADTNTVCVCGSLYFVGEIRKNFK